MDTLYRDVKINRRVTFIRKARLVYLVYGSIHYYNSVYTLVVFYPLKNEICFHIPK